MVDQRIQDALKFYAAHHADPDRVILDVGDKALTPNLMAAASADPNHELHDCVTHLVGVIDEDDIDVFCAVIREDHTYPLEEDSSADDII